ncbi:hypothetical protein VTN00DRAFT_8457 [Thermoascus crustaceus]|uniref:uncharacterized protein n=1 Tax=Thermoascus crustaceus TaxID=5088 RepID=UPI0037421E8E
MTADGPGPRKRPNFSTRTAAEDVARLAPSDSPSASPLLVNRGFDLRATQSASPYEPLNARSPPSPRDHALARKLFGGLFGWWDKGGNHQEQDSAGPSLLRHASLTGEVHLGHDGDRKERHAQKARASETSEKLGTFSGVFVPTTLNVLSILMFLRFGFILGQSGVLGMLGMLVAAYLINLVTTMSISAIATNGTVRGGGAYYLISRSLGPEFGGSIGIVFYLGFVFNTGMNAVGLVDCFAQNFGTKSGTWSNFLEEGFWWQYLWETIVLVLCTAICLAGSGIFARASNGLLFILLIATFSIPLSAIILKPFSIPRLGVEFTGLSWQTFLENLKPRFTKGAAGSQLKGRETFQDLFGILFPATGGIFAGASMSGDLKNPSRSIPKGTLSGLALTFVTYAIVILSMAASITRDSFYNNTNVIQVTNISGVIILLGEFASSFFSSLMGVIGSAKLLQAIARDGLLPGLSIFGQGTKKHDEPTYAIILTFVVTQLTMLFDINRIASFITMTYLMTFLVTNLACFLLKIGSAPNFRPSFHYFNWQTAAAGALISGVSMFFVDGLYATACVGILIVLFLLIHYTSPPKSWGDVSQSLIYHQVRKYLLRLKQEHVKFWRPQILLFVNDYETQYKMIHFCNSLKKGALFVLAHIIMTDDFSGAVPEARRQQTAWTKFVEYTKIKAFINISVAPTAEWGIRNTVLNSGLGGMRPNIVVIDQYRKDELLGEVFNRPLSARGRRRSLSSHGRDDRAPEICKPETSSSVKTYLTVLEDLLFKLRINVAVARGFEELELPNPRGKNTKKYIDLWPIQMSAELATDNESKQNVLTTNFDTYTLILQLGCILHTVPSWKKSYKLRVVVFVEYESDVEEERGRVEALLEKLRIEAQVVVYYLACGDLKSYQVIVNGDKSPETADSWDTVNSILKDEGWWQDIQKFRESARSSRGRGKLSKVAQLLGSMPTWPNSTFQEGGQRPLSQRFDGLRKWIRTSKRRRSIGSIGGLNLGMQTHRLLDTLVDYQVATSEESSGSESEFDAYVSGDDDEEGSLTPNFKRPDIFPSPQEPSDAVSDMALVDTSTEPEPEDRLPQQSIPSMTATAEDEGTPTNPSAGLRPPMKHTNSSSARFSSSPIPEAKVSTEEGTGPSIMFASSPPRDRDQQPSRSPHAHESIYAHHSPSSSSSSSSETNDRPASGFPAPAAIPLSFNDLPCRAQHLILNELMVKHSKETAVIFTTLPSPVEGTSLDEAASESYVSDMEVLCQGLPPCLLVHSNSMTVTMNL